MSILALILLGIIFLILLNGVFACMEIALVSVSKARLRRLEQENHPGAKAALFLHNNMDNFFATVQIGITFVATLSAAIGGDSSVELFTPLLEALGIDPSSSVGRVVALMGVTICISYVSLVIGELVPKSLARRYPGRISTFLAGFFKSFSMLMAPVIKILSGSTSLILKILMIPETKEAANVTAEEFRIMASELVDNRQISQQVHDILVRASRLAQTRVQDVMVPRPKILSVKVESEDDPEIRSKTLAMYRKHPFTNFPVTDMQGENVLGVINVKDLLLEDRPSKMLIRPVTFSSPGLTLDRLLATMQRNHTQISVVVDEYGIIDGLITIEDILEEFVGEIVSDVSRRTLPIAPSTGREPEPVVEGTISLHELRESVSICLPPSTDYSTLAGFLMQSLGRIPTPGDSVDYEGWRFEVTEMDGNRIRKVRVIALEK
ncbi:MAG: hemolysin family protein [Thermodesulfobacteriota bacterium]